MRAGRAVDRLTAVFLDRDGVINRKAPEGSYVRTWAEFEFLPGVLDALARLADATDIPVVVVTNQRGISRGHMTEDDVLDIHERMTAAVAEAGGCIDAVVFCPHEGGCACRKPEPGLLLLAAEALEFDPAQAVIVGDRESDMQAGAAAGARGILLGRDADDLAAAIDSLL